MPPPEFAAAMNVLGADPNFSVAGTYTAAPGGTPVSVRVVGPWRNDTPAALFTGARNAGFAVLLLQSEVPVKPPEDATLVVADGPFPGAYIVLEAEGDAEGTAWRVELQP
jgi:hypothetical protein